MFAILRHWSALPVLKTPKEFPIALQITIAMKLMEFVNRDSALRRLKRKIVQQMKLATLLMGHAKCSNVTKIHHAGLSSALSTNLVLQEFALSALQIKIAWQLLDQVIGVMTQL